MECSRMLVLLNLASVEVKMVRPSQRLKRVERELEHKTHGWKSRRLDWRQRVGDFDALMGSIYAVNGKSRETIVSGIKPELNKLFADTDLEERVAYRDARGATQALNLFNAISQEGASTAPQNGKFHPYIDGHFIWNLPTGGIREHLTVAIKDGYGLNDGGLEVDVKKGHWRQVYEAGLRQALLGLKVDVDVVNVVERAHREWATAKYVPTIRRILIYSGILTDSKIDELKAYQNRNHEWKAEGWKETLDVECGERTKTYESADKLRRAYLGANVTVYANEIVGKKLSTASFRKVTKEEEVRTSDLRNQVIGEEEVSALVRYALAGQDTGKPTLFEVTLRGAKDDGMRVRLYADSTYPIITVSSAPVDLSKLRASMNSYHLSNCIAMQRNEKELAKKG